MNLYAIKSQQAKLMKQDSCSFQNTPTHQTDFTKEHHSQEDTNIIKMGEFE